MQDVKQLATDTLTFHRYESGKVNMKRTVPFGASGEDAIDCYAFVEERPAKLDCEWKTTFLDGAGRTIRTGVYVNGEGHAFAVAWPED